MKPFMLNTVTWFMLTFGFVIMADTSDVPRNTHLVSKTVINHSNHQSVDLNDIKSSINHIHYSKSTLAPSPSEHKLLHNSNHNRCLKCHQGTINIKRSKRLKRSAMLLNKIVSALHKAMDHNNARSNRVYLEPYSSSLSSSQPMDLTRRTGSKKMFRKCYFNPVACF